MARVSILLCLALGSASSLQAADGCAGYRLTVAHELALLAAPAVELKAGATAAEAPRAELEHRLGVALAPEAAVTLAPPPGKRFPGGPFHAGWLLLEPPADGTWAVSAGLRLWFDIVDLATGSLVEASGFDMRADCPGLVKIVEFPLVGGRRYGLQLSSAPVERIELLVTPR